MLSAPVLPSIAPNSLAHNGFPTLRAVEVDRHWLPLVGYPHTSCSTNTAVAALSDGSEATSVAIGQAPWAS